MTAQTLSTPEPGCALVRPEVVFRTVSHPTDSNAIRSIVTRTGFFHDFEVDVAVELVDERLARGAASGYEFLFADDAATGRTIGYACYGPIACTVGSFDLYWVVVDPAEQGRGLGQELMRQAEALMAAPPYRARLVYVETSSRQQYEPTRRFYARCNYSVCAILKDFYAPDDDKVILVKRIQAPPGP